MSWSLRTHAGASVSLALFLLIAAPARADMITINFETVPALPTGPSAFPAVAPAPLNVPGIATVSGGAVLGNPAFLPAFTAQGSRPNLYGTTNAQTMGYAPGITIDFSPSILVSSVSGTVFNGLTDTESYRVTAFSGSANVGQQDLLNLLDNTSPAAFANFSLTPATQPITRLVISPIGPNGPAFYNFFADNVRVTVVPEPHSALLAAMGLLIVGGAYLRPRPARP